MCSRSILIKIKHFRTFRIQVVRSYLIFWNQALDKFGFLLSIEDNRIHNKDIDLISLQYFLQKSMIFTFVIAPKDPSESFCDITIDIAPIQIEEKVSYLANIST